MHLVWLPRALVLSLFLGWGAGCATFVENVRPVTYGKSAKDNYERGLRSMRGESGTATSAPS